jgi:hypothetical protein
MIGKTGSIITLDILDVAMLQNVADIPIYHCKSSGWH